MLAFTIPGEGFTRFLGEADIQEVLNSTAELNEEDLEHLTMFNELEDEEASELVKRPHLTISALKKDLQMADGLVDHFFEVDNFLDRCLKWKLGVASCKEVYEDTQRQSNQRSPLFSLSLLSAPILCIPHCLITL